MKSDLLSDTDLITLIKKGDKKAFDALFRKYYPILCYYGKQFLDIEDAKECVQDTMLWLWDNRENLEINSSLSNYLCTIVRNRALNNIHREQIKIKVETSFFNENTALNYSTDLCQLNELTTLIKDAIISLPESYRKTFILHRFKGLTYKEISENLEISPKTVDYRIQQALKILRNRLHDYLEHSS